MDVKKNISSIVESYVRKYPEENDLLKQAVYMKRALYSQGFEKGSDMRPLYELSETLNSLLIETLEPEELEWLKTKKGGNWFAKTFNAYSLI